MTTLTRHKEPNPAQQAAALEQFEIQLLKDQLRQQRIAHTEEISAIKRQAEQEPLERMIERWNGYQAAVARAEKAEADLAKARAEHAKVTEALQIATENADKLKQLADHYQDQCEKMLAKNNTNVEKATSTIDSLRQQIRELNTQIRTYRQMNPDRLQKQVKRLQDKNRTQQDTIASQRKQLSERDAELKKLKASERKLKQHNKQLILALDDACEMVTSGEADATVWQDDEWAIAGHEDSTRRVFIINKATGEHRVFDIDQGILRAKPVPAHVKAMAIDKLKTYQKVDEKIKELQ